MLIPLKDQALHDELLALALEKLSQVVEGHSGEEGFSSLEGVFFSKGELCTYSYERLQRPREVREVFTLHLGPTWVRVVRSREEVWFPELFPLAWMDRVAMEATTYKREDCRDIRMGTTYRGSARLMFRCGPFTLRL